MIGVRLVAINGPTRFRAIDQELTLEVDGVPMERERGLWDCFLYTPDEEQAAANVTVHAAGHTFRHTLAVRTLAEENRDTCPELRAVD